MVEILVIAAGTIVTVVASVAALAFWLGRKFAEINGRLSRIEGASRTLASASAEAHKIFVRFLALKGLLDRSEADYLNKTTEGVLRVYMEQLSNPLTPEELRFLKGFFSKELDERTVEEAERAYELGKRLFAQDFDERGFTLAMAAAYIGGYLISRDVKRSRTGRRRREISRP